MVKLQRLTSAPGVSLYDLVDEEYKRKAKSYDVPAPRLLVASSAQTQSICTRSDIVSPSFEKLLQQGIGAAMSRTALAGIIDQSLGDATSADLLFILRGGLNFDPKVGLRQLGISPVEHYLSSQRQRVRKRSGEDDWRIVDAGYKKMFEKETTPRAVNLVFGDIVASGRSLEQGIDVFFKEMQVRESWLRSLTFFTIGGDQTQEKILEKLGEYRSLLGEGFQAQIVYLEGRFGLATKKTPLLIKNTGTDLLAYHEGAIITPGFALALFAKPEYVLEGCVIYDGGKRRSAQGAHFNEVTGYWKKLQQRARKEGLTLHDAINERYPILDVDSVEELLRRHHHWQGVERSVLEEILDIKNFRLSPLPDTAAALDELCQSRLSLLEEKKSAPRRRVTRGHNPSHHLGLTAEFFEDVRTVLFAGEAARVDAIYAAMDGQEGRIKTGRGMPVVRGYMLLHHEGKYHRVPLVAITSGMGGGSVDITDLEVLQKLVLESERGKFREELDHVQRMILQANPGKTVNLIRVGTCGTHQHDFVHGGDLIIADKVYGPFGFVEDVIATEHTNPDYHFELSLLQRLDRLISYDLENGNRERSYLPETLARDLLMLSQAAPLLKQQPQNERASKIYSLLWLQLENKTVTREQKTAHLDAVRTLMARMEVIEVPSCDPEIVRYSLTASKDATLLGGGKIYRGGVFSKQTLSSEAWDAFDMKPDAQRSVILDYRQKVLQDLGVYASDMELAMMTAQAYRANQEGHHVRVGGIMAVVNNPRDPSRSVNPLFADDMTIARAVRGAIEIGLRVSGEIYRREVLKG